MTADEQTSTDQVSQRGDLPVGTAKPLPLYLVVFAALFWAVCITTLAFIAWDRTQGG